MLTNPRAPEASGTILLFQPEQLAKDGGILVAFILRGMRTMSALPGNSFGAAIPPTAASYSHWAGQDKSASHIVIWC